MRLELTGRHLTITTAIRALVEERLAHILRVLNDSAVSAKVVLTKQKTRVHAELTLHARGEHFLHGEGTGRDMQAAVAAAAGKIDRQVQKLKSRWVERKRRSVSPRKASVAAAPTDNGARAPRVIRMRRYAVKPMSVEDAAAEIGDGRDAVLVFRNSTNDAVTVLFRRPDGNLGLIEPEI